MSQNRRSRREWQRKRRKEPLLSPYLFGERDGRRSSSGLLDSTPYNAIRLLRHESEKTIVGTTSLVILKGGKSGRAK